MPSIARSTLVSALFQFVFHKAHFFFPSFLFSESYHQQAPDAVPVAWPHESRASYWAANTRTNTAATGREYYSMTSSNRLASLTTNSLNASGGTRQHDFLLQQEVSGIAGPTGTPSTFHVVTALTKLTQIQVASASIAAANRMSKTVSSLLTSPSSQPPATRQIRPATTLHRPHRTRRPSTATARPTSTATAPTSSLVSLALSSSAVRLARVRCGRE